MCLIGSRNDTIACCSCWGFYLLNLADYDMTCISQFQQGSAFNTATIWGCRSLKSSFLRLCVLCAKLRVRYFAVGQARKFLAQPFTNQQLELISTVVLVRPRDFLANLKRKLGHGSEASRRFYWQTPDLPQTCLSFTFSEDCQNLEQRGLEGQCLYLTPL